RDPILGYEILELPRDQPIDHADSNGEAWIEKREEEVAEAQHVAAQLVGVAFRSLRLERLALAFQPQTLLPERLQSVFHILDRLLDWPCGSLGVALQAYIVVARSPRLPRSQSR